MTDLRQHIDDLEKQADERTLLAELAIQPEARDYNARLAAELREEAKEVRRRLAIK